MKITNNKSYGMLIPVDVHINCRIRRKNHITEVINKEDKEIFIEAEEHYRGGILFEGGDNDAEL